MIDFAKKAIVKSADFSYVDRMLNARTTSFVLALTLSISACVLNPTIEDDLSNDANRRSEENTDEPPQNTQAAIPPESIAVIQESCWSAPYLEVHTDMTDCSTWNSPTVLTLYLGGDVPPTTNVTYTVGPISEELYEIPGHNLATGDYSSGSLTIRPEGDEYIGEYDLIKSDGTPLSGTFRSVFCTEDWDSCGGF